MGTYAHKYIELDSLLQESLKEYENPLKNTNCVVFVLLFGKGTFNEALNKVKEIVRHGISTDDVTTTKAH